jgi:hypothetical protein
MRYVPVLERKKFRIIHSPNVSLPISFFSSAVTHLGDSAVFWQRKQKNLEPSEQ